MIKQNYLEFLSAITLFALIFMGTVSTNAAPVRFNQVKQIVNAKPGKANTGNYTKLVISNDPVNDPVNDPKSDNDNDKSGTKTPQQDDRVITETTFEIITEEDCNCIQPPKGGGFPYWALLGLAAIPVAILLTRDDDKPPRFVPTPTMTPPQTMTPTPTMTMTPTPTMTPPPTSPTPPPVPEPMTILLFGTGLAGVGFAARKRFGRRDEDEEETEI